MGSVIWYCPKEGNENALIMCSSCMDKLKDIIVEVSPTREREGKREQSGIPNDLKSRDEMIAQAHAENMAANVELVMAIRQLTVAVNDRTRLLVKNMEAKP